MKSFFELFIPGESFQQRRCISLTSLFRNAQLSEKQTGINKNELSLEEHDSDGSAKDGVL